MSISSIALSQLVGGLALATSQFQQGHAATDIFTGLHPFLPAENITNGLSPAIEPLLKLSSGNGSLATDLAPEAFAGAFYEASRQLALLTQESHPRISLWADDVRRIWRSGLSHRPPAISAERAPEEDDDAAEVVAQFRRFTENSPEPRGLIECREDGEASLVMLNKTNRELWKLDERQITGLNVLQFFYPEDHETIRAFIRRCLAEGKATHTGMRMLRRSGGHFMVDMYAGLVENSRFADFQVINESEREQALEEAQRLDSARETASHIAHDLNNSLTIISGGLQVIAMGNPSEEFLASMQFHADMMAGMVNSFRRMNDTVEGEVDVHSLLDPAMIRLIVPKMKDVEISMDLAGSPWKVPGPNYTVSELINNIIKNALESMENTPTRKLKVNTENVELLGEASLRRLDPENRFPDARPGNFLKLSVEDTGSGIPPEALRRIFQDYFSTKNRKEARGGRGLSSAQKAIAKRGGLLTVRSLVGHGTVFEIYLPQVEEGAAGNTKQVPSAAASSMLDQRWKSRGDEVVLVADDDKTIRDQYDKILQKYYGYKVVFATTTQEALRVVEEHPNLSAVILDWRLPGDTGDVLLGDLQALRPKLPILVNTGLIPDHRHQHPDVSFTVKLKGTTNVARAVRRLIDGEPIDS